MNKDKLRKNINHRVRIRPIARRFNGKVELEQIDDEWTIYEVTADGVIIRNRRIGHTKLLGFDHIHQYTSDPDRYSDGFKCGFLTLTVQLNIDRNKIWIEPISLNK